MSGSLPGKLCGIGPVGFPRRFTPRRRAGGFPLRPPRRRRRPADRIATKSALQSPPGLTRVNSLGVFPDSPHPSLSLFCRTGFMRQPDPVPLAEGAVSFHPQFPLPHARQATLHASRRCPITSIMIQNRPAYAGSFPGPRHKSGGTGRRRIVRAARPGPPRKRGPRPHAVADRPASLTPGVNPRLGVESQHQELHRCALRRIFRPAFMMAG